MDGTKPDVGSKLENKKNKTKKKGGDLGNKMMNCVFEMMDFVFEMLNFALKMMDVNRP